MEEEMACSFLTKVFVLAFALLTVTNNNSFAQVYGNDNPVADIDHRYQAKGKIIDHINFFKRTPQGLVPIQMTSNEKQEIKNGRFPQSLSNKLQKAMQETGLPYHLDFGCKDSDRSNV